MTKKEKFREQVKKASELNALILKTESDVKSLDCKDLLFNIRIEGKDAHEAHHGAYLSDFEEVEKVRAFVFELLSEKLLRLENEIDNCL
jgi:hypothetical protein